MITGPTIKNSIKKNLPESNFIDEWEDLRNVMWSGNGVVAPRKFVNSMQNMAGAKNRDLFTGWSQNDMPEFLMFLIDCMHNSISRPIEVSISGNIENDIDNIAVKCYELVKNIYTYIELNNTKLCESTDIVDPLFFTDMDTDTSAADGRPAADGQPRCCKWIVLVSSGVECVEEPALYLR